MPVIRSGTVGRASFFWVGWTCLGGSSFRMNWGGETAVGSMESLDYRQNYESLAKNTNLKSNNGENIYFCCWPFKLFKGFLKNVGSSDIRRWGVFFFPPDRCVKKRKRSFPPLGSCCNDERVRCSMCVRTQAGWVFSPLFFLVATQCYFALIFQKKYGRVFVRT